MCITAHIRGVKEGIKDLVVAQWDLSQAIKTGIKERVEEKNRVKNE